MGEQIQKLLAHKKKEKCKNLYIKNQQKAYKKKLIIKKFKEDQSNQEELKVKYKKLRLMQQEKDNKLVEQIGEEVGEILKELREEFYSDLNPEDIPNSDVSSVDDSDIEDQINQGMI